jgi:hypothetical protein
MPAEYATDQNFLSSNPFQILLSIDLTQPERITTPLCGALAPAFDRGQARPVLARPQSRPSQHLHG